MTTHHTPSHDAGLLERTYAARAAVVWELLTTPGGLNEWWAPDGFETRVTRLELRAGGRLDYTMTATSPDQVAFLRDGGMPLSNQFSKQLTDVVAPTRLAYRSLIDFVPGHQPYQHLTTVDVEPLGVRTRVVLTLDPLHDPTWTQRHRAHRREELDHLAVAVERRTRSIPSRSRSARMPQRMSRGSGE